MGRVWVRERVREEGPNERERSSGFAFGSIGGRAGGDVRPRGDGEARGEASIGGEESGGGGGEGGGEAKDYGGRGRDAARGAEAARKVDEGVGSNCPPRSSARVVYEDSNALSRRDASIAFGAIPMQLRVLLAPHPTSFAESVARGGKEALIALIVGRHRDRQSREVWHSRIFNLDGRDLFAVVFSYAHAVIPASSQNGPAMKLVHGKKVASPSTRLSIR